MKIIVQKFGGTSVASEEARIAVKDKVQQAIRNGFAPVVVVSAMGRKGAPYATDTLIDTLKEANISVNVREMDLLMCCGEIISSCVMAATLQKYGINAMALTGGQAGIITDSADSHTYSSSLTNDHSFGSLGSIYVDYSFDNYITTPIVENKTEYYYGYAYTYQQTTGYKYSETACIKSLSFSVSLGRFSSHSEKTVEAIKSKLIAKGFKDDGTGSLLSDKGTKITIKSGDFSDDIILTYYFQSVDDFVDTVTK